MLRACPRLRILATSREALGISGETVWRVPSLAVPPTELLAAHEVELFEAVLAAAAALRAGSPSGAELFPFEYATRDRWLREARTSLAAEAEPAWSAGSLMSLERAVEYALAIE